MISSQPSFSPLPSQPNIIQQVFYFSFCSKPPAPYSKNYPFPFPPCLLSQHRHYRLSFWLEWRPRYSVHLPASAYLPHCLLFYHLQVCFSGYSSIAGFLLIPSSHYGQTFTVPVPLPLISFFGHTTPIYSLASSTFNF